MINNPEYLELVSKFISFKSVSTDKEYLPQIIEAAEWLKEVFIKNKFDVEIVKDFGNPLVIASYIVDPSYETCLVYGHYDVQPAKQEDGWDSDPYTLVENENSLTARGVADNKGQIAIHMDTVFQLIKEGKLKYNIKFLIEGEEESGSAGVIRFIKELGEKLAADFLLISDGSFGDGMPEIEKSVRGALNLEIKMRTANTDAHSGTLGGVLPNAGLEMSRLTQKMVDNDNLVQIPGFYDGVTPIDPEIISANSNIHFSEERIKEIIGCKKIFLQPNVDYYTQLGLYPSLEITGISSGYTDKGFRNGVPSTSICKINIRTAPNQDPKKLFIEIKNWIVSQVPDYVEVEVEKIVAVNGVMLDTSNQYAVQAKETIEDVYGTPAIEVYKGFTLPLMAALVELGIPQVIVPLANDDDNVHAVNENFKKENIEKGMEFSRKFFSKEK